MTYPDALSYLGQTRRFGMKLGLEPMREMARKLGDPQDDLRFIHLAGTNGKGSTGVFCESCLRTSGFRVGLYTSPHLVSVRERIQVDRRPISEADFAAGMTEVRRAVEEMGNHEATFFELMTTLALWCFGREKVDWVVWETGLGGRLDATNIVRPEMSIITNIGLDHQQYLGESLREIATEKAGIIKPGAPVISAVEEGEAAGVIRECAQAAGCALTLVRLDREVVDLGLRGDKQMARIEGREFALGLIGPHQVFNAACAVEAMRQCKMPEAAVARGLAGTVWPGRFEILSEKPLIVLDGAHNAAGMAMLVATWRAFLAERYGWNAHEIDSRARLVFASVADKDISEMAQLLRPLAREVLLVRLANERGAEPAQLAPAFNGLPCGCYNSVSDVWQDIVVADPESVTLITGSLFLVGEMLARRQGNAEEYGLNERLEKFALTR
ncbi:MAG: bifunctional folylpolyglutamate synthase/dihydrofolate synthase [Methylacidiphilales bacterium]|nr:bifunctional folylpolyglutamate synthase/dihydrofolate synthase [Candidatus Methylacidiphilales bacterium]